MGTKQLSEKEREELDEILKDLLHISEMKEIELEELDDLLSELESNKVKAYLKDLRVGKPERALKEELLAGESVLSKYFMGEKTPEARLGKKISGFVDYLAEEERSKIPLEVKPLFTLRGGKLKREDLDWKRHREQVREYLKEHAFLILTNLRSWYFFSRSDLDNPITGDAVHLKEFQEEFDRMRSLREYIGELDIRSMRKPLDEAFFESLDRWVNTLQEVEFKEGINEKEKLEAIVRLINKFIFVETLTRLHIVPTSKVSIIKKWEDSQAWVKEEDRIREFLNDINRFFYKYYDTEYFETAGSGTFLDKIKDEEKNIRTFYKQLEKVLGVQHWQRVTKWGKGITQFNYRRIDEDIFGYAYQHYLSELRKEKGIFYTPKYITKYIVENTVGKMFDAKISKVNKALENEAFDEAKKHVDELFALKVLDPACGSGSFLIKALRQIWEKYEKIDREITKLERKYRKNYKNGLKWPKEDRKKRRELKEIQNMLRFHDKRKRIFTIILHHLYGNDLDRRAIEVAKVNLWLESIKLAPSAFEHELIPEGLSLPKLKLNLQCGDSLVGLPEKTVGNLLQERKREKIKKLFDCKKEYIQDHKRVELVEEAKKIKKKLKKGLKENFENYFSEKGLNLSRNTLAEINPSHWALSFWSAYFSEEGNFSNEGFDIIVGNPPYLSSKEIDSKYKSILEKLYKTAKGQYDLYNCFIEKSYRLLKDGGKFGFIIPDSFLARETFEDTRELILDDTSIHSLDKVKGVFEDPNVSNVILIYSKERKKENQFRFRSCSSLKEFKEGIPKTLQVNQKFFLNLPRSKLLFIDEEAYQVIKKMEKLGDPLESHISGDLTHRGEEIGKNSVKVHGSRQKNDLKIVFGEDISRYSIAFNDRWINKSDVEKNLEMYQSKKIIVRQVGERMNAAFDGKEGYITPQACYNLVLKEKKDNKYRGILGVLNSKLMTFYYSINYKEKQLFPRILLGNLKELPILIDYSISKTVARINLLKRQRKWVKQTFNNLLKNFNLTESKSLDYYFSPNSPERTKKYGMNVAKSTVKREERGIIREYRIKLKENLLIIQVRYKGKETFIDALRIYFEDMNFRTFFYLSLKSQEGAKRYRTKKDVIKTLMEDMQVPLYAESRLLKDNINVCEKLMSTLIKEFNESVKNRFNNSPVKNLDLAKIEEKIREANEKINELVYDLYELTPEERATVEKTL